MCSVRWCSVISTAVSGLSFTGYGAASVVVGLLLAVFSTLLGHSIFSWCLKFFSPSFVSASKLCEPVAAAAFALFLFREVPALLQIAGGVVTIGGRSPLFSGGKEENDVLKENSKIKLPKKVEIIWKKLYNSDNK